MIRSVIRQSRLLSTTYGKGWIAKAVVRSLSTMPASQVYPPVFPGMMKFNNAGPSLPLIHINSDNSEDKTKMLVAALETDVATQPTRLDSRYLLKQPDRVKISWLKSVFLDVMPITSETLNSNLEVAVLYCPHQPAPQNSNIIPDKRPIDDSWLELILPFSDHVGLRESMIRFDGKTVRHGKLFEIIDAFAGDVAYRHFGGRKDGCNKDLVIVTASVEGFKLYNQINLQCDLRMQGYVSYVNNSSMEVTVDMWSTAPDGKPIFIGHTQFIMVAR